MEKDVPYIPDDIWLLIFKYLSVDQLCCVIRKVCKKWNELSYDFTLWTKLNLRKYGNTITDKDVLDIASQVGEHLKILDLQGCKKISDLIFASNKFQCPKLEEINVIRTCITENGLSNLILDLKKAPNLNSIRCEFTNWDPENNYYELCCQAYQGGRKLKTLYDPYKNATWSSDDILPINIGNGLLKIASLFTSLESLTVSNNSLDGFALEAICKSNTRISSLSISGCLWAVDSLETMASHLICLKELDISNTPCLDIELIKVAEKSPHIEKLNVTGCRKITDVGLCKASEMWPNIKTLILNNCKGLSGNITNAGLQSIATNCKNLQNLILIFCPSVYDAGIEAIAEGCPLLASIDVTGCLALTDKSVIALSEFSKHLVEFSGSECVQLTADSVNKLILNCRKLQFLELETCHYLTNLQLESQSQRDVCQTETEFDYIPQSLVTECLLASPCRIRILNLGFCSNIDTDCVKQIAASCPILQNLSLRGCYLVTDSSIESLAMRCKLLQILDLCASTTQQSNFTDTALYALAEHSQNLVMLNINKCSNITIEGVKMVLEKCHLLKRFAMSGKTISMLDVVEFCNQTRGSCIIDGMNVAYLSKNSKRDYLMRFPPLVKLFW